MRSDRATAKPGLRSMGLRATRLAQAEDAGRVDGRGRSNGGAAQPRAHTPGGGPVGLAAGYIFAPFEVATFTIGGRRNIVDALKRRGFEGWRCGGKECVAHHLVPQAIVFGYVSAVAKQRG